MLLDPFDHLLGVGLQRLPDLFGYLDAVRRVDLDRHTALDSCVRRVQLAIANDHVCVFGHDEIVADGDGDLDGPRPHHLQVRVGELVVEGGEEQGFGSVLVPRKADGTEPDRGIPFRVDSQMFRHLRRELLEVGNQQTPDRFLLGAAQGEIADEEGQVAEREVRLPQRLEVRSAEVKHHRAFALIQHHHPLLAGERRGVDHQRARGKNEARRDAERSVNHLQPFLLSADEDSRGRKDETRAGRRSVSKVAQIDDKSGSRSRGADQFRVVFPLSAPPAGAQWAPAQMNWARRRP